VLICLAVYPIDIDVNVRVVVVAVTRPSPLATRPCDREIEKESALGFLSKISRVSDFPFTNDMDFLKEISVFRTKEIEFLNKENRF